MQVTSHSPVFVFSDFRVDPNRRLLLHGDETVALHPKAFELLLMLVENRDRVISKNELLNTIWEGQFVEENNLAVQVSALRKVYGENSREHRFIVTVPGRGYRFVSDVAVETEPATNGNMESGVELGSRTPFSTVGSSHLESVPRISLFRYGIAVFIVLAAGALLYWAGGNRRAHTEPKMTRLTASGKVVNAAISQDGKFVVFAQKEGNGESLWLRQIETGSQVRLVQPQELEYVGLSISPDNSFIYYSTFGENRAATMLQRIALLGGEPENVGTIDTGVAVSFSPDGKRIVYAEASSHTRESYLKVADADGANPSVVIRAPEAERVIEDHKAGPAAWSPDGSEVAVAVSNVDAKMTGIQLINPETGAERTLVPPRFSRIHSVAWQGSRTLGFVGSEYSGSESQVWAADAKTGDVRRITNDVQNYIWLSASRQGSLLTIQASELSSIKVAAFDDRAASLTPREILHEPDILGVTFGPDRSVFYTSRLGGTREIWRVSPDGSNPQQVTTGANVVKNFAVSPRDGSLVFTSSREGANSLWMVDADGKNLRRLTDGQDFNPQFMPDGGSIVFQRGSHDFPSIWRIAIDRTSPPVELTQIHSIDPAVSFDGSRIAFYFMDKTDGQWRIGLVDSTTGQFLSKLDFPRPVAERRMRWHPSGDFIGQIFNTGENANLLLVPASRGEPHVVSNLGNGVVNSFAWSADGNTLLYLLTTETHDAVSLTNF
jgi:DNA-binding winged helix-turn-helix (wHTH) protein/Tol biopolymer transport system component